jgi:hypothetical protein
MQRVSQERNSRVGEMEVELTFKKGVEGSNRSSSWEAKAVNRMYLPAVVQTIPFTSTLSEQVIVASQAVSCVCVFVWLCGERLACALVGVGPSSLFQTVFLLFCRFFNQRIV